MRLLVAWAALVAAAPVGAATLQEAQSLYDRNRVAEAERGFAAVAADSAQPRDDRSGAERQLARIAWLIDGDADRALDRLKRATAIGGNLCLDATLTARVLREAGRGREALGREGELLAACPEPESRDAVRTHLIGARLDLALRGRRPDRALVAAASAEGARLVDRSDVEGARVRLQAALLGGEADGALAAWKDYFWLDEGDAPQALAPLGVSARFRAGLAANAPAADRLRLAELLMRAGFADSARRYAAAVGLPGEASADPLWRKLTAYWQARDEIKATELRVNRGLARGKRDENALRDSAVAATKALMVAAGASGDPANALREHYGLVGTVGQTSGYPSIHMGHIIEDHAETVSQYGKSAPIHYRAIDNMVGNGFESWLWDGSAMVGGWTADGVIVHIRPGYVRSPMHAWRLTSDGDDRRRLLARQPRRAAADVAALKARPVATLDGLNDRLRMQVGDQIWAGARSRGRDEAEVKRLFLAEYSRATLDQSIRVHEGRHAIDNALGLTDQPVLEYQAKLAELALTAYPRMALENMNRNLEGEGPHDRAGARVFAGFKSWMEANANQIMGYDPAVPVLAQLDKLTDGQMREIAMSLDPLAQAEATASADSRSGKSTR